MNLFSIHLSDDADPAVVEFVRDLLLEIAAQPGVDLVTYDPSLVGGDAGVDVPELENGE